MSKFALAYTGPVASFGQEVVQLLRKHPQLMFVEQRRGLYEVVAEPGFDQLVRGETHWRAQELAAGRAC